MEPKNKYIYIYIKFYNGAGEMLSILMYIKR